MRWLLAILLAQTPNGWKPPQLRVQQGGTTQGYVSTLNCSTGTTCTVGASVATITSSGGGGGTPGGVNGNVQINNAGAFGAYTGTSCTYAVKSLNASGAATCSAAPTDLSGEPFITKTASANLSNEFALGSLASGLLLNTTTTGVPTIYAGTSCVAGQYMNALDASGVKTCAQVAYSQVSGTPSIPADISGAHYVTTQAEAGLSAEAVLPTCTGTDKLTFNGTTISCAADVSGSGAPTTAQYWTGAPDGALSAEKDLSALATALVINTGGVPSAYAGATSCTNQFFTGLSAIGASTCTTATLSSAQFANQGTTTTVLHGNAAGNPSFAAVADADLTGTVGIAHGGTNSTATATAGGVGYGTGTAHAYSAAGTAGQALVSGGAGAPTWAPGGPCVTLGTATGATTTVGPVIWTGTYTTFIINYEIKGYNGGTPVGRILTGAASISTTALTNGSSMSEGIAGTLTNALSIPGAPLAVTLSAIGRSGTMHIRGNSGSLKRYEIIGQNGNASVSAASTLFRSVGNFSDLGTNLPLQRAQLTVYDTLTATAASAQAFTTGTTITVIGCP